MYMIDVLLIVPIAPQWDAQAPHSCKTEKYIVIIEVTVERCWKIKQKKKKVTLLMLSMKFNWQWHS